VWQELRNEVFPRGLEIVTVAMDTAGAEAARPFIELAAPEHPALIDAAHVVGELFGVVNVPSGVWIDENGMIVRPAEPAFPGRSPVFDEIRNADVAAAGSAEGEGLSLVNQVRGTSSRLPPAVVEQIELTKDIVIEAELYRAMLLDWAANGSASQYVLTPDEVVRRSAPRSADVARAAAHFELGQHLYRTEAPAAAVAHWREAHRLQADNWTYKRQAWRLDPLAGQGASSYDSGWSADVKAIGAENYYPRIQP
jgi:hypothetical protein